MDTFHPEILAKLAEDAKQRRAAQDLKRAAEASKQSQAAAKRANDAFDARLTGAGA